MIKNGIKCCSKCQKPLARARRQRYCLACHAEIMRVTRENKKRQQVLEKGLLYAAISLLECVPVDNPDSEMNYHNVYLPGFDERLKLFQEILQAWQKK